MSSEKIIVLYERLSREDENLGESYSKSNQKKLLEDYCREKGWTRFRHFTDDGISGTTFDRPSFKAMTTMSMMLILQRWLLFRILQITTSP